MDHRGYEARDPKDVKTETFGVWLPDNEGLEIKNVLELVDRCNPDIHLKDIRLKYNAKGSGGMLHVAAVQQPSLKSLKNGTGHLSLDLGGCSSRNKNKVRNQRKSGVQKYPQRYRWILHLMWQHRMRKSVLLQEELRSLRTLTRLGRKPAPTEVA